MSGSFKFRVSCQIVQDTSQCLVSKSVVSARTEESFHSLDIHSIETATCACLCPTTAACADCGDRQLGLKMRFRCAFNGYPVLALSRPGVGYRNAGRTIGE